MLKTQRHVRDYQRSNASAQCIRAPQGSWTNLSWPVRQSESPTVVDLKLVATILALPFSLLDRPVHQGGLGLSPQDNHKQGTQALPSIECLPCLLQWRRQLCPFVGGNDTLIGKNKKMRHTLLNSSHLTQGRWALALTAHLAEPALRELHVQNITLGAADHTARRHWTMLSPTWTAPTLFHSRNSRQPPPTAPYMQETC